MIDPVKRMEAEAARAGVEVSERDRDKARGDKDVTDARMMAKVLREPLLAKAGFVLRASPDGGGVWDNARRGLRLLCSIAREDDGRIWAHLSVSHRTHRMPTFAELRWVKEAIYPDRVALQVFPPESEWYTYDHPQAAEVLHLFVCLTERPTPDFRGSAGTL